MTLHLHGLGHFHPTNEITNRFLEDLDIGTNDEWIMERVGIRSRRTTLPLDYIQATKNVDPRAGLEAATVTNPQMAARAARMAIERAGIDASQIGMVVSGCSAPDSASPCEAAYIARELGLEVPVFDVNSACTSLFAQLYVLSLMRDDALPPFVLVCAPEALSRTVDYRDRSAAVLWGDAAAAAVVSLREPGRARILGNRLRSSPEGAPFVVVPRLGHFAQEGRKVQMFAIRKTCDVFEELRAEFEDADRALHFVGHQANLRMLENVCRRCEVADDRHHFNVDWYGNTGAASAATVVSMRWEKWTERDDVGVVGVGSGLTWSGYLLRFGAAAGGGA
ncbi:MAG: 3-oxoacyl-[acyl-carrier-protein] synthase III C-terminal domain-containing protein [Myxococcota bacterium]